MPRSARIAPGGIVYHALNRAVVSLPLFEKKADFEAFERVLNEAHQRTLTRILVYCVMPNHWHFVLWPKADGELTTFLRWLTHTPCAGMLMITLGARGTCTREAIRHCVTRGTPFGSERWIENTTARLGLTHTLRPRGRPRKAKD